MPKKSEFIKLMERGEVDDSYNKRGDKVASSRSRKASDKNVKNKKTGQQAQDDFTKLFKNMSKIAGMNIWSEPNVDTFNNIFNKKDKKKLN